MVPSATPLTALRRYGLSAIHPDRVTPRHKLLSPGLRRLVTLRPDAFFGEWEEDRGDESAAER
jgi:hypothetical protein